MGGAGPEGGALGGRIGSRVGAGNVGAYCVAGRGRLRRGGGCAGVVGLRLGRRGGVSGFRVDLGRRRWPYSVSVRARARRAWREHFTLCAFRAWQRYNTAPGASPCGEAGAGAGPSARPYGDFTLRLARASSVITRRCRAVFVRPLPGAMDTSRLCVCVQSMRIGSRRRLGGHQGHCPTLLYASAHGLAIQPLTAQQFAALWPYICSGSGLASSAAAALADCAPPHTVETSLCSSEWVFDVSPPPHTRRGDSSSHRMLVGRPKKGLGSGVFKPRTRRYVRRCVACGVWCVASGVWCVVSGV